ncbi:MAG: hypothetical protein KGP29_06400 [Proteobacteria bacterium]|nr:hypothetical protein [Pseudomonadota bacterium]
MTGSFSNSQQSQINQVVSGVMQRHFPDQYFGETASDAISLAMNSQHSSKNAVEDLIKGMEKFPLELQSMIRANQNEVFLWAIQNGYLGTLNLMLEVIPEGQRLGVVRSLQDKAFRFAALNGHLPVVDRILEVVPEEQRLEVIHSLKDEAFRFAAKNGHLPVVDRILEVVPEGQTLRVIRSNGDGAFIHAAKNGHLPVVDRILELVPEEQRLGVVRSNGDEAFIHAARNGHLPVVDRILELVPDEQRLGVVHSDDDAAFRFAALNGHLPVVDRILEVVPEEQRLRVIRSLNDEAFIYAALNGHLPVVDRILEVVPEEQRLGVVHSNGDGAFIHAGKNGHLPVVNRILELVPEDQILQMIERIPARDRSQNFTRLISIILDQNPNPEDTKTLKLKELHRDLRTNFASSSTTEESAIKANRAIAALLTGENLKTAGKYFSELSSIVDEDDFRTNSSKKQTPKLNPELTREVFKYYSSSVDFGSSLSESDKRTAFITLEKFFGKPATEIKSTKAKAARESASARSGHLSAGGGEQSQER